MYLNDLERYLSANDNNGITLDYRDEEITFYLQILILLYADDTIIISQSAEAFQKTLNDFHNYCQYIRN